MSSFFFIRKYNVSKLNAAKFVLFEKLNYLPTPISCLVFIHDILMWRREGALLVVAEQGKTLVYNLDVALQVRLVAAHKLALVARPSE